MLTFDRIVNSPYRTGYVVRKDGRKIGCVYSRGTQPIEWGAIRDKNHRVIFCYTSRAAAVRGLMLCT